MAGEFSKTALPARPGAYVNFQAREAEPRLSNTLGVVAIPFTHSWGPSEQIVELNSFGEFLSVFGQGGTTPPNFTPGYIAVHDAFRGEGLGGRGGAGTVLAFRMAGTDEATASLALANTAATGGTNALTVRGIYSGSYGNRISVAVEPSAQRPATHDDFVVFVEGREAERFSYVRADTAALAAALANSQWVRATSNTTGTPLAPIGATPLAGGNDGTTLTGADYAAWMSALETRRFSLAAPSNLTDAAILTSLVTWAKNLNRKGKRFMTVVGGAPGEAVDAAVARSASIDDPNFVNVGGGIFTDARFGDLSSAQLAPRIAGILAARGEALSLTFARLSGLTIKVGLNEGEILTALANGVLVIGRDSHPDAPTRIEKQLTAFVTRGDVNRPYSVYSVPKFVRTMHSFESEITEFAEVNVIGQLQVSDGTRDFLRGQMEARLEAREEAGVIQPGWSVATDQNPPPSPTDEFIALTYEMRFGRSVEQVLNTIVIG